MEFPTFQHNKPLFVKRPFRADGKDWKKGEEFTWLTRYLEVDKVSLLFNQGFVVHNLEKEIEEKAGDRLAEFNSTNLRYLRESLNNTVRRRTTSKDEFKRLQCRYSNNIERQRALVRRFLQLNPWIINDEELKKSGEDFVSVRDRILK